MKRKKSANPPPVGAIFPEGGEPLYEEAGTGLRLTASDYAVKHGFENVKDVEKAYQEAMMHDRRTTESDNDQIGDGI
jgi:hypothetical protein